jgi:hypothetical protein
MVNNSVLIMGHFTMIIIGAVWIYQTGTLQHLTTTSAAAVALPSAVW